MDAQKIAVCGKLLLTTETNILAGTKPRLITSITNDLLRAKNLLQARRSCTDIIQSYKQYSHNVSLQPFEDSKELHKFYLKQIDVLEKQIAILDEKIELLLEQLGYLEEKKNLETIPGI